MSKKPAWYSELEEDLDPRNMNLIMSYFNVLLELTKDRTQTNGKRAVETLMKHTDISEEAAEEFVQIVMSSEFCIWTNTDEQGYMMWYLKDN